MGWTLMGFNDNYSPNTGGNSGEFKEQRDRSVPAGSDLQQMRIEEHEISRVSASKGDLIICEGGEPGRAAIWEGPSSIVIQKALHRFRCGIHVIPKFILLCLETDFFSKRLAKFYTGVTIRHLTGQSLAAYSIPVPPLQEQMRIVEQVNRIITLLDQLEVQLYSAREEAHHFAKAAIEKLTGIRIKDEEKMKIPKTQLISTLRIGVSPVNREQAPLAAILIKNNNELSAKTLWDISGLEIARAVGDRWYAALCFTLLTGVEGITLSRVGLEVTYARFQSAVADWRTIGDPTFTAVGLANLSMCALWLGRYDEARLALEESVELCRSVGERWELGFAYRGLGLVAQAQGEHRQALDMFRKSLDTFTELGARHEMARVLAEMSRSIFELGDGAEAGRQWRESLRIATETQGTFIVLEALVGLASLQAKQGDREPALELLWLVLNHPASLQETKNRAARLRTELEAQLTSQQIEVALARAHVKTLEASVDELLK